METKTGTIKQIEQKTAKNSMVYWVITIDNMKFNTFNPLHADLDIGTFVEYTMEKNEKGFNTLKGIRIAKEQTKAAVEAPKAEFHLTKEAVRLGALECAIKVTKKLGTEDYPADLMTNAKLFEKYILDGI